MSRTNETRHRMTWTCNCKCRLDAGVCNNKKCWNDDKCRCECKELIDKSVCDKGSIWNPSNSECKCDKSYDVDEYLDYENCKCMKKSVDKLDGECTVNIDKVKIAEITFAVRENVCVCSYIVCIFLAVIDLAISTGIGAYFAYFSWHLKKDVTCVKFGTCTQWNCAQTTI